MKHLLGAAFVVAIIILIIIGLTTDEPMPMYDGDTGMAGQPHQSEHIDN